jgi:hypothetical protein
MVNGFVVGYDIDLVSISLAQQHSDFCVFYSLDTKVIVGFLDFIRGEFQKYHDNSISACELYGEMAI